MSKDLISNTTCHVSKLTMAKAALEDKLIQKHKHNGNLSDDSQSPMVGKKIKHSMHLGPLIRCQSSGITPVTSDNKSNGTTTTMDNNHGANSSPADELMELENELSDKASAASDDPITLEDKLGALYWHLSQM